MDRTRYTEELNDIIGFMETDVLDSFPSRKLSLEHLVVAILESPKSHAYMLLKSCTMSSALDKVKAIYTSYLSKNSHVMTAIKKNSVDYDDGLTKVLTDAESIKLPNDEGKIGSEHVLISLLQQESPYDKTSEAFKNIGVNHSFVKSRCSSSKERLQDKNRDKKQQGAKGISFNIVNGNMQPQQQDDFLAKYTTTVDGCLSDDIVGRKEETELILRTLSKRSKKNVILVGNCGVGKTAIVYNIARLIKNNLVPSALKGCKIVRLNTSSLIGGTHFRGMLEERIDGVFKALEDSKKTILFIDDIQQVVKNSSKEKDSDISQQLGNALSNGRITVIATTNFKDYRNGIEKDPLLSRQFQKIIIEEPNIDECINILNNIKTNYELYHNVNYDNNIINNIVKLSKKYITSRSLPDSAVDVLDLCGVYAKEKSSDNEELNRLTIALNEAEERKKAFISKGDFEKARDCELQYSSIKKQISTIERHSEGEKTKVSVTEEHVASTISTMTGIPINKLSVDEKERVGKIDEILKTFIKGQDEAIDKICKPIKRSKIGLCGRNRVISAQLLVGSSGVGKTLLAKKLAEEIFGSEKNLIRLDMSEYADKSSISKLLGAYSITLLINGELYAVRDSAAMKPLAIAEKDGNFIIASETVAFDVINANYIRDVRPGEIIYFEDTAIKSAMLDDAETTKTSHCVFEYVYFARPDSVIDGVSVYEARSNIGKALYELYPVDADVVMAVPDSSIPAAIGYSEASGIPYAEGMIKNRYVGRTFIMPTQEERELAVRLKLNPISRNLKGKKIVLIDDSIVRGTTSIQLLNVLKQYEPAEIHLLIGCPPVIAPCFYGVAMATKEELIAANHTVEEIREILDIDTLGYITKEKLVEAVGFPEEELCSGCVTEEYPTEIPENLEPEAYYKII